ncbi:hypothetical protein [Roseovarius indicus]|jgi:hypothetical protein|uniref:hypothetical protein n=1 Tax=Roseovarius indicus TaxID=540747 RepID=UPI0009ED2D3B|nr:hypothetical protein [Roseovarius indicus]
MKRLALLLSLLAAPAMADGMYNGKTVDCYCTDKSGSRVEIGEMTCLHVDGRTFMAQCQMSLNNPMWREISDGCLSSSLSEPVQPPVNALGVHSQI